MPSSLSFLTKYFPIGPHRQLAGEDLRQGEGFREMSDILPSELWTEILVRLPVRALLTLQCVSKSFRSLIQNPNFGYLHFSRFNNPNSESMGPDLLLLEKFGSITVCRGNTSTKKPEFTISIESGDDVVGYVNGLLWLHRFKSSIKYMMLCNPSIRKCLLIPPSPASHLGRTEVGFGYDPKEDDYKAVVIVYVGSFEDDRGFDIIPSTIVEVYSLKTGSWRRVGVDLVPGDWSLGKSVYANGAVHWLATCFNYKECFHLKTRYVSRVISFDLGTGIFSFRELPKDNGNDGCACVCAGSWACPLILKFPVSNRGGSLAILYLQHTRICVWVMEENGWTQECMMESSSGLYDYLSSASDLVNTVLLFKKTGELLIVVENEGLIVYNIKTKECKATHDYLVSFVGRYVESLLWKELLPSSHPLPINQA